MPGRWAVYLGFSLLAAALLVLAGILPKVLKERELSASINQLETSIARQEILRPMFASIVGELQAPQPEPETPVGTLPEPRTVEDITVYLERMARTCGIGSFAFVPVPESLSREGQRLAVSATLTTKPQQLQTFLTCLTLAEGFSHLQELDISKPESGLQAKMLFWLQLPAKGA